MAVFKDKGIVLKDIPVGESDKLLVVLMKEHGKITISAKGARKPKSKFASSSQPFAYSDFVVFEGNGFFSVTQCDVIESFYSIRNDFLKYCYGSLFMELTEKMILQAMPVKKIMLLMLKSFSALNKDSIPTELVAVIFQFKFLQIEGFSPLLDNCSVCGCFLEGNQYFFAGNGLVCKTCNKESNLRGVKISEATMYAMRYIMETAIEQLFSFTVSADVLKELLKTVQLFREEHLDFSCKSLELLR